MHCGGGETDVGGGTRLVRVCSASRAQSCTEFRLPVGGRAYGVGRAGAGNAVQLREAGVSRRHAELRIDGATHELALVDCSTFGTRVNGRALTRGVPHPLADRDRLEFGVHGCACTVHRVQLRIGASGLVPGARALRGSRSISMSSIYSLRSLALCLIYLYLCIYLLISTQHLLAFSCRFITTDSGESKRFRDALKRLGATESKLDFDWLVMPTVSVSQKLLRALVAGKHVVRTDWLEEAVRMGEQLEHCSDELAWPDPARFVPPTESSLAQFCPGDDLATGLAPNEMRERIFRRALFYFFSHAEHNLFAPVISGGGGHVIDFDIDKRGNAALEDDVRINSTGSQCKIYFCAGKLVRQVAVHCAPLSSDRGVFALYDLIRLCQRRME